MERSNVLDRLGQAAGEQKYRILSGSTLKLIAMISMLIDHLAAFVFTKSGFMNEPLLPAVSKGITIYKICRVIGRFAFPIFCFLITEGFIHTHDRKKYGINLLGFALISEIPWNLIHSGKLVYTSQNVFFTLFLGFAAIWSYETFKEDMPKLGAALLLLFIASVLLRSDYGSKGMAFILILYIMREQKILQAFIGSCVLSSPVFIMAAFVPINMYNGERGFIKGKAAKYAFYAFYPLHLLVLYLIRKAVFGS